MASKSSSSAEKSGPDDKKMSNRINRSIRIGSMQIVILVGLLAIKSVPWGDILFAVFASLYVYMLSRFVFPQPKVQPLGDWNFSGKRFLGYYVLVSETIGLYLPVALIVSSFLLGDQTTVRAAAPHLFLLSAQVLSEILTYQKSSVSLPVKATIAIMYNARRLLNLYTWIVVAFSEDLSTGWNLFGRCVVVGNVVLWNFNLWGFLLPVFLPWVLRNHYAAVITHAE